MLLLHIYNHLDHQHPLLQPVFLLLFCQLYPVMPVQPLSHFSSVLFYHHWLHAILVFTAGHRGLKLLELCHLFPILLCQPWICLWILLTIEVGQVKFCPAVCPQYQNSVHQVFQLSDLNLTCRVRRLTPGR